MVVFASEGNTFTTSLGCGRRCSVFFFLDSCLCSVYSLRLGNSSCCSFHSVDLWSYGGAFGHLPFFPLLWITFRDGTLSLNLVLTELWRGNLVLTELWRENLMLVFSDGSFRLSARIPFYFSGRTGRSIFSFLNG